MSERRRKARQFKQVDVEGEGDGADLTLLVSTDAMDSEGDVVEQSWEFDDTIQFLWSHKARDFPLGHITNPRIVDVARLDVPVSEDAEKGLVVDVDVDAEGDPRAALALHKFQRGDLNDSSVGFDPLEFDPFGDDEPGRFHFKRNRLREVSATNVGANPDVTTLRKSLGEIDEETERLLREIAESDDEPTDKDDTWSIAKVADAFNCNHATAEELIEMGADECLQAKEGRRNSRMDESAMTHIKELAEFLKGERDKGDIKPCEVCKPGDHDEGDKSGAPSTTVEVDAETVEAFIEEKVREVVGEKGQDEADEPEGDEAQDGDGEEPQGKPLCVDGEKTNLTIVRSEQPGSSSGDAGDGGTSETFTVDELFAQ